MKKVEKLTIWRRKQMWSNQIWKLKEIPDWEAIHEMKMYAMSEMFSYKLNVSNQLREMKWKWQKVLTGLSQKPKYGWKDDMQCTVTGNLVAWKAGKPEVRNISCLFCHAVWEKYLWLPAWLCVSFLRLKWQCEKMADLRETKWLGLPMMFPSRLVCLMW
jgi:hypothetical protein